MSKVFERVIYTRIMSFLRKFNVLTKNQYGFCPNHSTQLAIFQVLSYIVENVDRNEKVAGLFFDLSRAFDTIDHSILMKILYKCGIRGKGAQILESYLSDREQIVCIERNGVKCFSSSSLVKQGVPQGSALGPLLFILYVNGLCDSFVGSLICQYADDTSVVLSGSSFSGLSQACTGVPRVMH